MKRMLLSIIYFFTLLNSAQAQSTDAPQVSAVVLTATSGTLSGNYTTLKAAFDKINDGTHKGTITIKLGVSTTETASAVLKVSGSGLASYIRVLIYPTVSGVMISGGLNSAALVSLDGADNVTIDGRVNRTGSAVDMVIANLSTSSTAGTSTIEFTNNAKSDTVQYCTIRGASTIASTGTIIFTGSTSLGLGNDNNVIEYNTITNVSNSRPYNSILHQSNSTPGWSNDGNIIRYNNFKDVMNLSSTYGSTAIVVLDYSNSVTIQGNSFYETGYVVPSGTGPYYSVYVGSTHGNNITVNGNYIGGSAPSATGRMTKTNANDNSFCGIYLAADTGAVNNIQGNTIRNIYWSNSNTSNWTGINTSGGGSFNIGTTTGNTIGADTGRTSITYTAAVNAASFYGIYINSTGTTDCANTTVASITATNTSGNYSTNIYAMYKANKAGATTFRDNTIGSTNVARSINAASDPTTSSQAVFGISCTGSGANTISGNTIGNLHNATTKTSGYVNGVYYTTAASMTISDNMILSLTAGTEGATSTAALYGIRIVTGTAIVSNNIISLGVNTPTTIYGIYVSSTSIFSILFNTVSIGGSMTEGNYVSYALFSSSSYSTRKFQNNILSSTRSRSGSSTGAFYCVGHTEIPSALLTDYNDYSCSGTGNAVGLVSGITTVQTLSDLQTALGTDAHSTDVSPSFVDISGITPESFKPTVILSGLSGTGITTDHSGSTRASTPTMGAMERAMIYTRNIVDNPGAESNYTSWTKTDGGTGWGIDPSAGMGGTACWVTSYQNCTLTQTIDLSAKGISAATIDAFPSIQIGTYVYPGWDGSPTTPNRGTITIKFELLNASGTVLQTEYLANNTALSTSMTNWTSYSAEIRGYPTGVRYIRVTLVGKDAKNWGGTYGPGFDDVSVQIDGVALPVEISSFTSNVISGNVLLQWNTATEVNNYGFEVEKQSSINNWSKIGFVEGNGTTNAPKSYSFTDKAVAGKTSYRLKQIDRDGKFEYSQTIEVTAANTPKEFALAQNYPNPFNPTTVISYQLPVSGNVSLKIFDILGKEVAVLVNEVKEAGSYSAQFDGTKLSSGLYFYKLTTNQFSSIRKMLLLK